MLIVWLCALGAPVCAWADDGPALWMIVPGPATRALNGESLREVLPRAGAPDEWLARVWRMGCALAENGPGQLAVTAWPATGRASDAAFVVTLSAAGGEERAARTLIERLTRADAPPGVLLRAGDTPWAWRWEREAIRVAVGGEPLEALRALPLPRGDEFKAHEARWSAETASDALEIALFVDLNLVRAQAPERFARGPEGRLVEHLRIANARALGVAAISRGTPGNGRLGGRRLLTLALTWSARSQQPGSVKSLRVGESAWPERDAPPSPPAPVGGERTWVFAMRTDAGAGPLALGWGGLVRQGAALSCALQDDRASAEAHTERQQKWFMAQSGALRDVTTRLDRYALVYPTQGEPGMLTLDAPLRASAPPDDTSLIGALRTLIAAAGLNTEPAREGEGGVLVKAEGTPDAALRVEREPARVVRVVLYPHAISGWLIPAPPAR